MKKPLFTGDGIFTGIVESIKSQNPSTKLQTNLKFQYSMTKTGLGFGILVFVICLIFVICDLEFLFLQYYTTQILPSHHRGLCLPAQSEPEGSSHTPNRVKEEHQHWSHIP